MIERPGIPEEGVVVEEPSRQRGKEGQGRREGDEQGL